MKKIIENYSIEYGAFALSRIFKHSDRLTHIHLLGREGALSQFSENLKFFNNEIKVVVYPSWDCLPYSNISPRKEIISKRYSALRASKSASKNCTVILLSVDSVLQKIIPASKILGKSLSLNIGQEIDITGLTGWLEKNGYSRQSNVYSIGEYAVRGGILDIFVPEVKYPLRLDFFGTNLENIRTFDPSSQRSNGSMNNVKIFPISEKVKT